MPRTLRRPGRRAVEPFRDGIHLDFARGVHYIKAAGLPATIAPFTSLFTFTGGNQSMYRGASGLLVASATNTPRIEYDANGNVLGLLIEGARTNLGLHSDDGTNAAWVKSNTTAAKTSTGPDGVANSATRVTATAGNGTILQTVTSASATRAYSVWLKRITGTGTINLTVDNGSTWTAKTITTDWARYDISQAAVTNPVFGIRIVTSADAVDFACNQLESAAFPSSYIPTTTGSVARTADSAVRTVASEVSSTVGTTVVQLDTQDVSTTNSRYFCLDDGSGNNRFALRFNASAVQAYSTGNTVADGTANASTATANTMMKTAIAYGGLNDLAVCLNGGTVVADGSVTALVGTLTRFSLYDSSGGDRLFGHIRRLSYFPERKSNAFLQQVTA